MMSGSCNCSMGKAILYCYTQVVSLISVQGYSPVDDFFIRLSQNRLPLLCGDFVRWYKTELLYPKPREPRH